jgi:hypothetical protein
LIDTQAIHRPFSGFFGAPLTHAPRQSELSDHSAVVLEAG